ncbi:MAG: VWA domain-containing protein [Myxococcales bacterium]|nr:VWA domain-containing protein [Myxococcales bacterium]
MPSLRMQQLFAVPMVLFFAAACAPESADNVAVAISHVAVGDDSVGGALVVQDRSGAQRNVDPSSVDLVAEVQDPATGEWEEVKVRFSGKTKRLHTVIVADNSGSQDGNLELVQSASTAFANGFLEKENKMGLVRVSTESRILSELSDDRQDVDDAINAMFVSNGWTALYDGIRMANEVLERGASTVDIKNKNWGCVDRPLGAIVVFTDGRDNNSADMQMTKYEGDGVDTRLGDLMSLSVLGVRTPVYAVGVGRGVDEVSLSKLAKSTGGFYSPVDNYKELLGALENEANTLTGASPFCFELPWCDVNTVRVHASFELDGESYTRTIEMAIPEGQCKAKKSKESESKKK